MSSEVCNKSGPPSHIEVEPIKMETKQDDSWVMSVEDDTLFKPRGLIGHNNGAEKSVFVTWNQHYLLNFRFKKSKQSKKVIMTRARILLPTNGHNYLRSIHMMEYNTLLLMSDGYVYCFASVKSLHIINWLSGVRCFARTNDGFSIIRHDEKSERLLLEIYYDLPSLLKGESTLQHSYDITGNDEQYMFHIDWQKEHYTLQTVTVTKTNEEWMSRLFGVTISNQQIHIFSVGGHVYVLVPQNETSSQSQSTYSINLLCIYTENVILIKLLPLRNLCLMYLSCGSIDIWYVSQILSLKQRQMYYTGAQWLDYDATSENDDIYYTDGSQLVSLRFQYYAELDECEVERSVKHISGIQACTWIQNTEELVCLSDNNIFYRIPFNSKAARLNGNFEEITSVEIELLRAESLTYCEHQPDLLKRSIEYEKEQQQLAALGYRFIKKKKSVIFALLTFCRHLPNVNTDALLLHTSTQVPLHSSGIYALLLLKLDECKQLALSPQWQILVFHGNHYAHAHFVSTNTLLNNKCQIVIPLRKRCSKQIPQLTVKFIAMVKLHSQIRAIVLPVEVRESKETYEKLFSGHLTAINLVKETKVADILLNSCKQVLKTLVHHKIKISESISMEAIAEICNAVYLIKNNTLDIYFVDKKLSINISDSCINIRSEDVTSFYYFKRHLIMNKPSYEQNRQLKLNDEDRTTLLKQITKLQCGIERFYGTQVQEAETIEMNGSIHLDTLLRAYDNIRKTLL